MKLPTSPNYKPSRDLAVGEICCFSSRYAQYPSQLVMILDVAENKDFGFTERGYLIVINDRPSWHSSYDFWPLDQLAMIEETVAAQPVQ